MPDEKERVMRATVTIDKEMLDELVRESGQKNKASAVREAIAVFLRIKTVEKIQRMRGQLTFDKTADELRHYER